MFRFEHQFECRKNQWVIIDDQYPTFRHQPSSTAKGYSSYGTTANDDRQLIQRAYQRTYRLGPIMSQEVMPALAIGCNGRDSDARPAEGAEFMRLNAP